MAWARQWSLAELDTYCGGVCGNVIHRGEPMLTKIASRDVRFVRCRNCADEKPPEFMPMHSARPASMLRPGVREEWTEPPAMVSVAALPLPFHVRSREPGEDDA